MSGVKEVLKLKDGSVKGKDGAAVSLDSLDNCELIGLYFSAHWCPPCRGFTPKLAECYKKIKENGKKFEVIFVSSDQDEEAFKHYYDSMPWLALSFEDRDKKEELDNKYDIQGIPTLVLLKPDGTLVNNEAEDKIAEDPEGAKYPWGY